MALEYYKCEAELPKANIEEAEIEQIACGSYIVDIHDILNREIKKEASEVKPFSEYGVSNECLAKNETAEDSPTHFWENRNFNGLAGELTKHKVSHLKKEYEDHSECNDESLTNNVELKTQTLKIEDGIDIIYEDVKPEICEEKAIGKRENESYPKSVTDILIGTEIRPNFSPEHSIDSETWPQQNIEENGTAAERDNDTRKTLKFHPFESTQDLNGIPDTEKPYQCKICLKAFTRKFLVRRHERIHTGEKLFQCKICLKSFSEKGHLTRHERVHTEEKAFHCKKCSKSFRAKASLLYHEKIHIGVKPFQCKICPKSFLAKQKLLDHETIHTGEKPFQCKVCPKSFKQIGSLTRHGRVHTGEKPFQCKICLKSFRAKDSLLNHERIHTGEKPFQCTLCPKNFAVKWSLVYHERIHEGEKPFRCKICPKSFSHKGHLPAHERIHTGEKPFRCKICLKSFNLKWTLSKHERRLHTGERPFQGKI